MLEVIGWVGSLLVIVSLMQARVLRFRVLNLAGAVIATFYNVAIEIWPFAVMNGVIAVIDVYWLWRLTRSRHDERTYAVVEVAPDDAYLRHLLTVHGADVARFQPDFALAAAPPAAAASREPGSTPAGRPAPSNRSSAPATSGALDDEGGARGEERARDEGVARGEAGVDGERAAFLVVRGDETVGVVVVRGVGDGVGRVELDYVTPRFRDFTPGEFVYRRSGVFAAHGFRSLEVLAGRRSAEYLRRVGFEPHDDVWVRPVAA